MKTLFYSFVQLSIFFSLLICSGCALIYPDKKWIAVKKGSSGYIHSVSDEDESFESIAMRFTGNEANAAEIATLNPGLDMKSIVPGSVVFIPEKLLMKQEEVQKEAEPELKPEPVKRKSVNKGTVKKEKESIIRKKEVKEDFELFGPR